MPRLEEQGMHGFLEEEKEIHDSKMMLKLTDGVIISVSRRPFRTVKTINHPEGIYESKLMTIIVEKQNGKKYEFQFEALQGQFREIKEEGKDAHAQDEKRNHL